MTAKIKVTIETVPHPDPKRAVDVMARIILNDILKQEEEAKQHASGGISSCTETEV